MKLPRKWFYFLFVSVFAALVANIALQTRAKHGKPEITEVKAEVSRNMAFGKSDPYADVKATSVLLSLMRKHPRATTYEVTWDTGRAHPTSLFYSVPDHILEFNAGDDFTSASHSLYSIVQVEMSRQDLEVVVARKIGRDSWNDWPRNGRKKDALFP